MNAKQIKSVRMRLLNDICDPNTHSSRIPGLVDALVKFETEAPGLLVVSKRKSKKVGLLSE